MKFKNIFKKNISEPKEIKAIQEAPTYTCCNCNVTANDRLFLINTKKKIWDFEGDAMCLECYIKTQVEKSIKTLVDERIASVKA